MLKIIKTKLSRGARLPRKAHPDDAGADIYSLDTVTLYRGDTYTFVSGVRIRLPDDCYALIVGRSSKAQHGLLTHVGVIDTGYTGEIGVTITNVGTKPRLVEEGDKIAQLLILPRLDCKHELVSDDEWDEIRQGATRGDNGFGSTGQ